MTKAFKPGDKVYYPEKTDRIFELIPSDCIMYPLRVRGYIGKNETFTTYGLKWEHGLAPSIFHATKENHKKLTEFYGVDFEEPAKPIDPNSPKEIIQAMLDDGWKYVPCLVTDMPTIILTADTVLDTVADLIVGVSDKGFKSMTDDWKYAFPVHPRTGDPVIGYRDGRMITGIRLG